MLLKFSVKNFRGFNDWLTFDLRTDKKYEFNEQSINEGVAQHVALYGKNAQGKTNLGFAMLDIIRHISHSSRFYPNIENTYLNADSAADTADFRYKFRLNDVEIDYDYGKNQDAEIFYEKLRINGKEVLSWDKKISMEAFIDLEGAEPLDRTLSDNIASLLIYVARNAKLTETKENQAFLSLIEFVNKMVYLKTLQNVNEFIGNRPESYKDLSEEIIQEYGLQELQAFLNKHGILCQLDSHKDLDGSLKIAHVSMHKKLEFFDIASSGTFSLIILFVWLKKMEKGKITFAFIDEFDAFYHHKLAVDVTKQVSNTNAQTIMTSHNTSIMSNSILRPDCYFSIENKQIKPLYQLSDRELRKAHNLEKMYRSGAFNE